MSQLSAGRLQPTSSRVSQSIQTDPTVREQLDKEGREDDVEGPEEGVSDGGGPAGGACRLPSPWLGCRLSADWKTCQVTLAPPTHSTTPELEPPPKTTSIFSWKLSTCCPAYTEV